MKFMDFARTFNRPKPRSSLGIVGNERGFFGTFIGLRAKQRHWAMHCSAMVSAWQALTQKLLKAIKGFECKINDQVLGAVLLDSNCRSDGQVQTPGISKSVAVIAGHDWLNLQKVLPLLQ